MASERKEEERRAIMPTRLYDNFFDNFQRQMESMMKRTWQFPTADWEVPSIFEARDMRMAVYELTDKGDKFEVQVEVPGVEKEKIDVKASKYSVEISGKHSEKTEEKVKRYLYTERLYRSFYRTIPLPEEIVPSRVSAKVENGILKIDLPKKTPTKGESETTKVEVK